MTARPFAREPDWNAWLVLALACAIAAGVAAGALVRHQWLAPGGALLLGLLAAPDAALALLLAWRGSRPAALANAFGLAVVVAVAFPIVTGFALVWQGLDAKNVAAAALLGASALMMPSALAAYRLLPGERRRTWHWAAGLLLPLVYGAGVYGGVTWMQEQRTQQALAMSANDRAAGAAVEAIVKCAGAYRERDLAGSFPAGLDALAAGGCLSGEVARGAAPGYALTYLPGVRDASGAIAIFAVCAQPQNWQVSGTQVLVADESGARAAFLADEARTATPACHDAMPIPSRLVQRVKYCALRYARNHPQVGYPRTLADMVDEAEGCLPLPGAGLIWYQAPEYRLTYLTGEADAAFKILLRGAGGMANQYADSNGASYRFEGRMPPRIAKLPRPWQEQQHRKRSAPGALAAECEAGNHDSCYWLGHLAAMGTGDVPQDPRRARPLLERACDNGIGPACTELTRLEDPRTGDIPAAPDRAERDQRNLGLWERACQLGDPTACVDAAYVHRSGSAPDRSLLEQMAVGLAAGQQPVRLPPPVVRDPARARALMQRACELDLDSACMDLADDLLGTHTAAMPDTNNLATALRLLQSRCDRGEEVPCYRLAQWYARESTPFADKARARTLFLAACDASGTLGCAEAALLWPQDERSGGTAAMAIEMAERGCRPPATQSEGCQILKQHYEKRCADGQAASCLDLALQFHRDGIAAGQSGAGRELLEKACQGGEARACDTLRTLRLRESRPAGPR